jgi:hypothetical protein
MRRNTRKRVRKIWQRGGKFYLQVRSLGNPPPENFHWKRQLFRKERRQWKEKRTKVLLLHVGANPLSRHLLEESVNQQNPEGRVKESCYAEMLGSVAANCLFPRRTSVTAL